MELFLSMAGDDMENIRMELEKLISYTLGPGGHHRDEMFWRLHRTGDKPHLLRWCRLL